LSPEKDLVTLLRAFAQVFKSLPRARLVLVGSGPSKDTLQELTRQLGVADSVDFAGSKDVNGLRDEYLRASCFVLPSTSEPWGLVVNEALSYGCPVVVSHRCGCVPELVVDGVSGYSFTASDVDDLSKKMLKVVIEFSDPQDTANKCLSVISAYTPEAAAQQILEGCTATLARLRPNA
jgi:glycosyltransferase involved in cell wall biosynthesis